ncbi:MAG: N-acetyltransferase [Candidatus Coatesbacteria bacterium]|nr:N-acetyltransferase [Candidatus Coatesbacteria bacterium]
MSFFMHTSSKAGVSTKIGYGSVIMENVILGDNCEIGCKVIIHPDTIIGSNVRIDDHTVIGKKPMRAANSIMTTEDNLPAAIISDNSIIGSFVAIYRGAEIGEKVLVADFASVRENVQIGSFTIIGRGVTVENYCKIGKYCKLESESYLTAYSTVEDRVFIAPGVLTSNDNFIGRTKERFKYFKGVTIKRGGRIGVGAVILPGKTINEDALVAGGSLVTKDVPARKIVAGVPARIFREVPEEQLLANQEWKDIEKEKE